MDKQVQNNNIIYTSTNGKTSVALFKCDDSMWVNQRLRPYSYDRLLSMEGHPNNT
ncbi:hypothetical protein [Maribacter ulvicola]|uniref:Uncharacterized protein n=1 Tax=Maribacter ulvicola TaxID=228959 RepID=A0A1N6V7Y3_9FLAO|nr:hypothetical protein [Maribacter ulvicola]SIQ73898.1 hypothetical protein SAMN05421797_10325 [Maribacter ulvicola]